MSSGNRIALLFAATALAAATAAPHGAAWAQTGYTQSYGATQAGPAKAPTGSPGVGTTPGPTRPPYQSNIGLPYGPGNQAPYAYGGGLPTTNDPNARKTPSPQGDDALASPGKPGLPKVTRPGVNASTTPGARPADGQGSAPGSGPGGAATGQDPTQGQGQGQGIDATTGTAGIAPLDPRLGGPVRNFSGPGNGQPLIKAAPDYKSGDPFARGAGSPALAPPIGASPYTRPYTVDAQGNYYNSTGNYVGKVDNRGQVRDRYGSVRGTVQR